MDNVLNMSEEKTVTPVQQQAAEVAADNNLDAAQTGIFSKVSDMVSNGILSLSNMYQDFTNNASSSLDSIKADYAQYQQLEKEAAEAKNHTRLQDGIASVAGKLKNKQYSINPQKLKQEMKQLASLSADQIRGVQLQLNLPSTGKVDEDTATNLILYKNFLGEQKSSDLLSKITNGTLEGLRSNPVSNAKVLKSPLMQYGDKAVKALEQREGPLTYVEQRVAEEEGFFNGFYYDSKGVVTFGAGQTQQYMDKSFKETVKAREQVTKKLIKAYDKLPDTIQAELVQSVYRGGLSGSPKTIKLINENNHQAAAKAFLNNDEYRKAKRENSGIAKRMEKTARAIRMMSAILVPQDY